MGLSILLSTLFLSYPLIFMPFYISEGKSFPKPLSSEEEADGIRRMETGTEKERLEAKNALIEHNLRLVAHIREKVFEYGH